MSEVRYTDQHEWVRVDGGEATVGITKYAAEQLGDVVFVELPEAGRKVGKGGEAAVVESVPAASEVYTPVGGEVTVVERGAHRRSRQGQRRSGRRGLVLRNSRTSTPAKSSAQTDVARHSTTSL